MKNFYHWLNGSVIIYIQGNHVEKFLNLVIQQQIEITEICWQNDTLISAKVPWYSLGKLRHIAKQSKCRFRIYRRGGFPLFWLKAKRRKALVWGSIVFVAIVYVASFIALDIQVTSPEPLTEVRLEEVVALAEKNGIRPYHSTWFMDFHQAEKEILKELPALSWVGIHTEKGKIVINVVEKKLIEQEEQDFLFGNILANKDGLIENILVRKGTAAVEKGTTVISGQPLVWGNNGYQRLAADAIILARVWYQGFGECSTLETAHKLTGNEKKNFLLTNAAGQSILLWGSKETPYSLYHQQEISYPLVIWRQYQLPFIGNVIAYQEEEAVSVTRSEEDALQEAISRGKLEARKKVPPQAEIIEEYVRVMTKGPALFQVQVTLEVREDIGAFVPLPAEEQKQLAPPAPSAEKTE